MCHFFVMKSDINDPLATRQERDTNSGAVLYKRIPYTILKSAVCTLSYVT